MDTRTGFLAEASKNLEASVKIVKPKVLLFKECDDERWNTLAGKYDLKDLI